jgi:hypothetical protein
MYTHPLSLLLGLLYVYIPFELTFRQSVVLTRKQVQAAVVRTQGRVAVRHFHTS